MSTTVAFVIPEWMLWPIGVWAVLSIIEAAQKVYLKHLEKKLLDEKRRGEKLDHAQSKREAKDA